jgi:hypothetical protein
MILINTYRKYGYTAQMVRFCVEVLSLEIRTYKTHFYPPIFLTTEKALRGIFYLSVWSDIGSIILKVILNMKENNFLECSLPRWLQKIKDT